MFIKLNERKIKILEAIIHDYIVTAEPIGSRTIAKKYDLGISSATIRNEMSDLEDLGLIIAPHTSAGRIPSDKGYRLYVDRLMHSHNLTQDEINLLRQVIINNINKIDSLMRETARAIAAITKYTTIVSEPKPVNLTKIRHLQLVPLDGNAVVLVVISDEKEIQSNVIRVQNAPDYATLLKLTGVLNDNLSGLNVAEIDKKIIKRLETDFGDYASILIPILKSIFTTLSENSESHIYMSGIKNLLAFPEFSDLEKARAIFQTLEEKDMLVTLLGNDNSENIQIIIGAENRLLQMHDCSIIKTNYSIGGKNYGSIGILGPTRMDYPQVVSVLGTIANSIKNVFNSFDDNFG